MIKIEVDKHSALWFSILSSNKILILAIDISQEGLTEVMIIGVIVNSEILTLTKVLLFAL